MSARFWAQVRKTETCWLWQGASTTPCEKAGRSIVQARSQEAGRQAPAGQTRHSGSDAQRRSAHPIGAAGGARGVAS